MPSTLLCSAYRASSDEPFVPRVTHEPVTFEPMSLARAAVILAAGASQRMGTPKALLPWRGVTLLEHALEQACAAGIEEVVVVLGPATGDLELPVTTVLNPRPESGRSTSIRLGCQALPDHIAAVLIQSVDQPAAAELLGALFDTLASAGADVALPVHAGRRGHPICISGRVLGELRAVSEEEHGLRAVVRRHAHATVEVAVDDESVLWNLNDPAAYAVAARTAGAR
jgi:molybdenum cofactor cytidylyltransferase